jgi:hypothetical protein
MSAVHEGCFFCLFLSVCCIRSPHVQCFQIVFNYKEILDKKSTLIIFFALPCNKLRYIYFTLRLKPSIGSREQSAVDVILIEWWWGEDGGGDHDDDDDDDEDDAALHLILLGWLNWEDWVWQGIKETILYNIVVENFERNKWF